LHEFRRIFLCHPLVIFFQFVSPWHQILAPPPWLKWASMHDCCTTVARP